MIVEIFFCLSQKDKNTTLQMEMFLITLTPAIMSRGVKNWGGKHLIRAGVIFRKCQTLRRLRFD